LCRGPHSVRPALDAHSSHTHCFGAGLPFPLARQPVRVIMFLQVHSYHYKIIIQPLLDHILQPSEGPSLPLKLADNKFETKLVPGAIQKHKHAEF